MGTVHLLEAVRKTPSVRAVVCVTTDKCYQNQEWIWPYRETDPLGGYDPYASSKACAEIVSAAYRSSFFPIDRLHEHHVALATARAGNVIGGGDWSEDRLIPDLVRGFVSGQPVLIRRPNAIRPWQHVLESLHGYLMLAEELLAQRAKFASSYNFGPSDEDVWPVERIATRLVHMWGNGASWIRRFGSQRARGSCSQAGCQQGPRRTRMETTAQNRSSTGVDDGLVSRLESRGQHGGIHRETDHGVWKAMSSLLVSDRMQSRNLFYW